MLSGIFAYTFTWMICMLIVWCEKSKKTYSLVFKGLELSSHKKIGNTGIIAIALVFTLYNYYITVNSVIMGSDRQNYLVNFLGYRQSPSIGLVFIMDFVHLIHGDINTLFFITSFICVFITIKAYQISEDATPNSLLLLFLTQYFLTILTALKQSYTDAIAILFFVIVIEQKKCNRLLPYICIIVACLFHPAGIVLLPLYIILNGYKRKSYLFVYFLSLIIIAVFFKQFVYFSGRILTPVLPSIGARLVDYFSETSQSDSSSIAFLKGLPYFFITIYGIVNRKMLYDKILNYDRYLLVSASGSMLILMGIYNSWLIRYIYVFSFPSFVFLDKILQTQYKKNTGIIIRIGIGAVLTFFTYRFLYLVYSSSGGF